VRREPYWVARPLVFGDYVRIGYLLSYYRDEGSNHPLCGQNPFFVHPSCNGHNGDSEGIYLGVYYNEATKHWVLDNAWLSRHDELMEHPRVQCNEGGACITNAYPPQFYYPSHPGAYPRVYVAEGKHANYATKTGCNGGGQYGTDTCERVDTATRLEWNACWNLGSRATPLRNCVPSRDPSYEYYGSGRQECFWTGGNFRGWIPLTVGGAEGSVYSAQLQAMGF
jgi:hypothetical protein